MFDSEVNVNHFNAYKDVAGNKVNLCLIKVSSKLFNVRIMAQDG